jgi:hypothetical protein
VNFDSVIPSKLSSGVIHAELRDYYRHPERIVILSEDCSSRSSAKSNRSRRIPAVLFAPVLLP